MKGSAAFLRFPLYGTISDEGQPSIRTQQKQGKSGAIWKIWTPLRVSCLYFGCDNWLGQRPTAPKYSNSSVNIGIRADNLAN